MASKRISRRAFLGTSAAAATAASVGLRKPTPGSIAGERVRRNVYHMDWNGPDFAAYREGVRVMKTRPATDPTSWAYQAAIHGSTAGLPLQNTCAHSTYFFLPWHRGYLYYFERILAAAAGVATAALPYWNYSVLGQASIPEPFRLPAAATNPLYVDATNRPLTGTNEVSAAAANYMSEVDQEAYTSTFSGSSLTNRGFGGARTATPVHSGSSTNQGTLENGVHNAVHGAVGGWMGGFNTAGLDPIFWLHHANIDRLWNRWLDMGGARANETDAAWLNTSYQFFDETASQVTIRTSDVLSVLALRYRYDDDPCPPERFVVVARPYKPFRPLRDICERYPILCGREPWPRIGPIPPGPLQLAPLQGVALGRTPQPFTVGDSAVILPIQLRGDRLIQLSEVLRNRDAAPKLEVELDVVDPPSGSILRLEVQRAVGRPNPNAAWVGVGQVAFFNAPDHKGTETATIPVPEALHEVLSRQGSREDVLAWRLRRVSGRQSAAGVEIPPARGAVRVQEARLLMKPAGTPPRSGTTPPSPRGA